MTANELGQYLAADEIIDGDHPRIVALSVQLRDRQPGRVGYARAAYEYVRDRIAHSFDVEDPRVSISASETLANGVGLCFAKAHLLAALLRVRGIPTGLCYQRLTDDGTSFVVHGLVAVHLDGAWHRQDPRGNKPGIDAQFSLGDERLAWPVRPGLGERDGPEIRVAALPSVITALRSTEDVLTLRDGGLPGEF